MKKSLMAIALLGAFGTAAAQTSVTVYGVADVGLNRVDNGTTTTTGLDSGLQSGSRLGFRGTEALGGGWSAIFTLESGFNLDNGRMGQDDRLFGRQAFVGVKSQSFGTLTLGRQYIPLYQAVEAVDPFGLSLAGDAGQIFNLYGDRTDNTVVYATPNFGGFSAQVAYAFGEAPGDSSLGRNVGAAGAYNNGPLLVQLAYNRQNLAISGADAGMAHTAMIGGTYDFNLAKLHLAYAQNDGENAAGTTNIDSKDWLVGASASLGPGTAMATYAHRKNDLLSDADSTLWAIGYSYPFSKRTNLYTSYGQVRNDALANLGGAAVAGEDPTQLNIGVRHKF